MENFDKSKFASAVNSAANLSGADPKKLSEAINSKDLNKVLGSLNKEQAEMLKKTLNDKTAVSNLLKSPKAMQILKDLMK